MRDESKEAIFLTQMMNPSESMSDKMADRMSDKMADKVNYSTLFLKRGR